MPVWFQIITLVSAFVWFGFFCWGAYRIVILNIPSSTKNAGISLVWGIINMILVLSVCATK